MKQLSFYEYTQLSKDEQYELVFTNGEFIESSTKKNVKFALYRLYNFYMEVVYDNKISHISSFINAKN